jgi:hypothetical protein
MPQTNGVPMPYFLPPLPPAPPPLQPSVNPFLTLAAAAGTSAAAASTGQLTSKPPAVALAWDLNAPDATIQDAEGSTTTPRVSWPKQLASQNVSQAARSQASLLLAEATGAGAAPSKPKVSPKHGSGPSQMLVPRPPSSPQLAGPSTGPTLGSARAVRSNSSAQLIAGSGSGSRRNEGASARGNGVDYQGLAVKQRSSDLRNGSVASSKQVSARGDKPPPLALPVSEALTQRPSNHGPESGSHSTSALPSSHRMSSRAGSAIPVPRDAALLQAHALGTQRNP